MITIARGRETFLSLEPDGKMSGDQYWEASSFPAAPYVTRASGVNGIKNKQGWLLSWNAFAPASELVSVSITPPVDKGFAPDGDKDNPYIIRLVNFEIAGRQGIKKAFCTLPFWLVDGAPESPYYG